VPNRLSSETSPYLKQHADNPVDWYPWGPEALERAKAEDKPILLSVGYAACHWCHVMAHESFENAETADLMNRHFINIKVDREERPDIDSIYMQAVQALTGQGGWPMTMFLLPDGTPFYGGTYYPPTDRQGMPSFRRVLESVAGSFANKRDGMTQSAAQIAAHLKSTAATMELASELDAATLENAYRSLARTYDVKHAGFGAAPKFPPSMSLEFLLTHWSRTGTDYALQMVRETFYAMIRGGIYDQVGGGMARYSTDATWLVPHFEKMLYDNAQLILLGVHLWQATKDEEVRVATGRTIEWIAREMTSAEGGFYASLDADSEGEEGRFYVWSERELDELLGDESALIKSYYAVSGGGNFDGHNILHVRDDPAATASRAGISPVELAERIGKAQRILYEWRAKRVWPGRDEKILAGWNGLALRAIATAARVFDRDDWRELALRNAEFLRTRMVRDGRLMRSYKDGFARIPGFLEDHASVALGFLAVYELTFDRKWLGRAREIADAMLLAFWNSDETKMYDSASDAESLFVRPRDVMDNALPSGNSLACELLLRLGDIFGEERYREIGVGIARGSASLVSRYAAAFGHLLVASDLIVNGAIEVALVGEPGAPDSIALERELARRFVPSLVLVAGPDEIEPLLALLRNRSKVEGKATAYVCRNYTCDQPVTDVKLFSAELAKLSSIAPGGLQ
jgi:uncharacterized protein YyaL (SSP411 family)